MATFLLTTDGTHGDVLPFLRLGQALVQRGHEVTLHTHDVYAGAARQAGLGFVATDTTADYARWQADGRELWLNVLTKTDHIAGFFERHGLWDAMRAEYQAMAAVIAQRPPGQVMVVGRHTTKFTPLLLREAFGVPAAWLCVTPTQFMSNALGGSVYPRAIGEPFNRLRATLGLPGLTDWPAWLSSADLLLGLWPAWFDGAGEPAPAGTALTGFVPHDDAEHGPLPPTVLDMTDLDVPMARRPVLVSGGSGQMLHPDWYRVAVQACAQAGRAGIVVCPHRHLLPDALPAGLHWYPDLPFGSLMPRVAAVLHHGGVLTSARGVASGIGQVIMAHGYDRSDNATRLRRLGVAEWLPAARWTPSAVAGLLTKVLSDPAYKRRAGALAATIDPVAAVEAACDRLESLVGTRPGQSPRRSTPGTDSEPERHVGAEPSPLAHLSAERRALLQRWLVSRT